MFTLRHTSRRSVSAAWQRLNSTQASGLADIDPSKLQITKSSSLKAPPNPEGLVFGRVFTDHMLSIPWAASSGWGTPHIHPYGPLALEPSSTVFHYAQSLFEGLKAYKNDRGDITMFRPDMNMKRMNSSAKRVALPNFNGDALLEILKQLIRIDAHWVPFEPGYSLYIRPTMIGTQRAIGVTPPDEALLFVILSPVGPYYKGGFKPVSLHGTTDYVRAAPGGTGAYKLGANYAPGVVPQREAAVYGYQQNLWLHGPDHLLTEVGTMNMFVAIRNSDGKPELITPPLDGMILPGVTRDSVLALAKGHVSGTLDVPGLPADLVVSERAIGMSEIQRAAADGRLIEMFGTGTAAIICPVDRIGYLGQDVQIPTGPDGMGPISRPILEGIVGRQRGKIPSEWSVIV